jgi:sorting nexin-17
MKKDNQLNILRPLYDFECPYLSLQQTNKIHENCCIVLKKSYWDLNFDLQLINDRRARNLLFVQAQHEIEQSQNLYSSDIYQQLEILCENKSFKDYLLLARTSKFYGHIFLRQCSMLYPIDDITKQKLCQCLLAIGNNELLCCINSDEKKKTKEISFKVIRIRCWKVNRTKQETSISIEYLIKKDHLEWIIIHTEQAPLVSACLQSMVDEILAKRTGATSPSVSVSVPVTPTTTTTTTIEQSPLQVSNRLAKRTESDLKRLNNNGIFEKDNDDDVL